MTYAGGGRTLNGLFPLRHVPRISGKAIDTTTPDVAHIVRTQRRHPVQPLHTDSALRYL